MAEKDPLSRMGLVRKPLFELFGNSKQIARDTAYSPQIRQEALEDQAIVANQQAFDMAQRDLRQQRQAQRAVGQYLKQPASTRQQFLDDTPAIALSPQYGAIDRYEDTMARTKAAQTLAPSLARKLPPTAAQRFYSNVEQGMGANEAFEEARDFDEQQAFRTRLAPYASDDEIKLRFPDGRFSAPEVARFEAEQKKKIGQDPHLDTLRDYYSDLSKRANTLASMGKTDPDLEGKMATTLAQIEERVTARLKPPAAAPAAAPGAATPTGAPPIAGDTPAPPAPAPAPDAAPVQEIKSFAELQSIDKSSDKKDVEIETINSQWTQAKQDLEKKLDAVAPDRAAKGTSVNMRERLARAIIDGERVPLKGATPNPESGEVPTESLARDVLQQLGLDPDGEAFSESGNRRTGSQKVRNQELLKAWAEDYLNQRGKLKPVKESPTGSKMTPEQEAAMQRLGKMIRGEN
jgi:hypothetical protein